MPRGIAARLGLILLVFLLLVVGSVAVTAISLRTLETDALVVNLAGQQRMLIQEMTRRALEIEKYGLEDGEAMHANALQEAADQFDHTLDVLIGGGEVLYLGETMVTLPAATDPALLGQLTVVHRRWLEFQGYVNTVLSAPPGSPDTFEATLRIEALSSLLATEIDTTVRLFKAVSDRRVAVLRAIQAAYFGCAVALLALGYWITRRTVIRPVLALEAAARRMADGDLATPIAASGPDEIGQLARSLETTRDKLAESRQELERWAATLETRVANRTRELAALIDVSAEITSHLDIDQVLRSVVDKASGLPGTEVAILCLLDGEGKALRAAAFNGPPGSVADRPQAITRGLTACVVSQGQTVYCSQRCGCALLQPEFHHGHLTAPLRAGNRIAGALCVTRPAKADGRAPAEFSPEEVQVLTLLANSAAIALENARLYAQAEQLAALAERERIAADLHDSLAQTLAFFTWKVARIQDLLTGGKSDEAGQELNSMGEVAAQTYGQVRQAILGLRQPGDHGDLATQLAGQAADFERHSGLPVEWIVEDERSVRLGAEAAGEIRRIVGEALTNARKHAGASRVRVRLGRENGRAVVTVEDDGCGFQPSQAPTDRQGHFGLSVMRMRAQRGGAGLLIDSAPRQGTRVIVRWPIEAG